jgi:hypothetical protein
MINHYHDIVARPWVSKLHEHKEYLLSFNTLQAWAGMSLLWRVHEFKRTHNVEIRQQTLQRLYHKHNISYRNAGYMSYNGFKITTAERKRYSIKLKEIIDSSKALIYVDEASFNTWKRASKTWAPRYKIVNIPLANSRNRGVTVYGAIGTCLKKAVFTREEKTCTEGFLRFLEKVRKQLAGPRNELIYMVADGAMAHRSLIAKAYMA